MKIIIHCLKSKLNIDTIAKEDFSDSILKNEKDDIQAMRSVLGKMLFGKEDVNFMLEVQKQIKVVLLILWKI